MTIDRKIIWQETKDYFNITLGLLLYTFGFTVFLLPYEIVTQIPNTPIPIYFPST